MLVTLRYDVVAGREEEQRRLLAHRILPELEHDGCSRTEVGCWYHCRRRFWEAAVAKSVVGREGLVRIGRIFELDESWKKKPPSEIKRLREQHLHAMFLKVFSLLNLASTI